MAARPEAPLANPAPVLFDAARHAQIQQWRNNIQPAQQVPHPIIEARRYLQQLPGQNYNPPYDMLPEPMEFEWERNANDPQIPDAGAAHQVQNIDLGAAQRLYEFRNENHRRRSHVQRRNSVRAARPNMNDFPEPARYFQGQLEQADLPNRIQDFPLQLPHLADLPGVLMDFDNFPQNDVPEAQDNARDYNGAEWRDRYRPPTPLARYAAQTAYDRRHPARTQTYPGPVQMQGGNMY